MQRLREDVDAAARSDAKVLIVGETGVGKEIVARMIHETGRRRTRNFVTINCAGLPDSLLESELFGHVRGSFTGAYRDKPGLAAMAHNGTLFLDELGETSLRMQALLLRFVENGEIQRVGSDRIDGRVDVRIIAATNRNLAKRIGEGEFREDLYYRLNVIRLAIPPLRERGDDVTMLLRHYLSESATTHQVDLPRLTPTAEKILTSHRWPGNVRELKNVVERLVIRHSGRDIVADDLPAEILDAVTFAHDRSPQAPTQAQTETKSRAEVLWDSMVVGGESFWTVVYPAFIDRELDFLQTWARQQALRPLVSELRKKMESIRRAELARVQGELTPELQADLFDRLSKRLLEQVLALPIAALEEADITPDAAEAQYLRRLFALEPGAPV